MVVKCLDRFLKRKDYLLIIDKLLITCDIVETITFDTKYPN